MKRAVIDIETIPNDVTISDPDELKKAALNPLYGRIVCIGVLELEETSPIASFAIVDQNESELLTAFWEHLRSRGIRRFIAHNGLSFDLPFIWKRSVICRVRPSIEFDLRKFRNDFIFDIMNVWSNWDMKSSPSLEALASGLAVGSKNGSGGAVADLWALEQYVDIAKYCLHDCWLTYACYCRMNFHEPHSEESIPMELVTPQASLCSSASFATIGQ